MRIIQEIIRLVFSDSQKRLLVLVAVLAAANVGIKLHQGSIGGVQPDVPAHASAPADGQKIMGATRKEAGGVDQVVEIEFVSQVAVSRVVSIRGASQIRVTLDGDTPHVTITPAAVTSRELVKRALSSVSS